MHGQRKLGGGERRNRERERVARRVRDRGAQAGQRHRRRGTTQLQKKAGRVEAATASMAETQADRCRLR